MAASSPPVPEEVRIMTSLVVWKNGRIPSLQRVTSSMNSGPRWPTIWSEPAWRTASGRGVGPGMRRYWGGTEVSSLGLGMMGRRWSGLDA